MLHIPYMMYSYMIIFYVCSEYHDNIRTDNWAEDVISTVLLRVCAACSSSGAAFAKQLLN